MLRSNRSARIGAVVLALASFAALFPGSARADDIRAADRNDFGRH